MTELLSSDTGWLNITNIALGVAVLVCFAAVGRVVIQELRLRVAVRARRPVADDDHAFALSSLGITMADGGVPIDENSTAARPRKPAEEDPPNVLRSDN